MSNSKEVKTVIGYVVDHKESGVRYAVSPDNFNPKLHTKVRPLKSSETLRGFHPRRVSKSTTAATLTPQAPSTEGSQEITK